MTAVIEAEATEGTTETEAKEPAKRGRKPESRDWTETREDHESLANYINEHTDLGITGSQVKAVFLLRGEWTNTPERVAEREEAAKLTEAEKEKKAAAKAAREAEKAKYANETPEEKAVRLEREKTIKAADRATKRAEALQAKAKELREQAGLDTEEVAEEEVESPVNDEDAEEAFAEVSEDVAEVSEDEPFQEAESKPARRPRKRP